MAEIFWFSERVNWENLLSINGSYKPNPSHFSFEFQLLVEKGRPKAQNGDKEFDLFLCVF